MSNSELTYRKYLRSSLINGYSTGRNILGIYISCNTIIERSQSESQCLLFNHHVTVDKPLLCTCEFYNFKDKYLLYSTWNSAERYAPAWMGVGFGENGYMHTYG